jgi:4-diphosphocytidyl-2C-methyl-D-erythritol kinase
MHLAGLGHPKQQLLPRTETFVLLVPDIHCSTGDVYNAWLSTNEASTDPMLGRNDLYPAAVRCYPELAAYRNTMNEIGGLYSGMTGSGSAFFAAFPSRTEASLAYEKLTRQEPGCRVYYCQPTKSGFAEPRNIGFAEPTSIGFAE